MFVSNAFTILSPHTTTSIGNRNRNRNGIISSTTKTKLNFKSSRIRIEREDKRQRHNHELNQNRRPLLPHSQSKSQSKSHSQQRHRRNKFQLRAVNKDNDGNSSSSNPDEEKEHQPDVNTLFATYMAQRKDKGFSSDEYNINPTANRATTNKVSNNSNNNNNNNNSDPTIVTNSNMEGAGAGGTKGNGQENNDNSNNSNISNNDATTTAAAATTTTAASAARRIASNIPGSSIASHIPGIRRLLTTTPTSSTDDFVQHIPIDPSSSSSSSSASASVQHIPIDQTLSPASTTSSSSSSSYNAQEQNQSQNSSSNNSNNSNNSSSTKSPNPPSLLEQDLQRIDKNYEQIQSQMKSQLDELRNNSNNNDVPDTMDQVLNQVIQEQKAHEVKEVQNQRALESFEEYYKNRMKETIKDNAVNASSSSSSSSMSSSSSTNNNDNGLYNQDPIVKEIVQEITKEKELRLKQEEQYRQYKEYEESIRKRTNDIMKTNINNNDTSNNNKNINNSNAMDFDEMQLEILQDLLQRRLQGSEKSEFEDEDLYTTDNIEEGIMELQERIDNKEYNNGSDGNGDVYQPESLKEWQMYRAIATKLSNTKKQKQDDEDENGIENGIFDGFNSGGSEGRILFDVMNKDENDFVRQKVEAWKEFQLKEEDMRKQTGLAITYRPPFEWSDKPDDNDVSSSSSLKSKKPFDFDKAEEEREKLDQLALEVLANLMMKTKDETRKEKIRLEIKALEVAIQARKEAIAKRGPIVIEKRTVKPIGINAALGRGKKSSPEKKRTSTEAVSKVQGPTDGRKESIQDGSSFLLEKKYDDDDYSFDNDIEDTDEPPDSQFFKDMEEDNLDDFSPNASIISGEDTADESEEIEINLGTMEEQKFRSMVARSGIRTVEEETKLKTDWEDFQKAEQMMREKSGLSGASTLESTSIETKYDVDNIFKDGDIDADAILGTIGKRPSRKDRKQGKIETNSKEEKTVIGEETKVEVQDRNNQSTLDHQLEESKAIESQKKNTAVINNATDEAVSSINEKKNEQVISQRGSLTFGQESDTEKQFLSNAFSTSFEERKGNLLDYPILSVSQLNTLMGLKRSVFSTGVSPYLARVNKPFQEFGAIFMFEGALVDITGLQYEAWKRTARIYDFNVPTLDDTKLASVHSEEYAVQKVFYWTDDIFALRKVVETFREKRDEVFQESIQSNNTESSISDSISADSNKAFENGTDVFVEADITSMQLKAWQKSANDYGFEAPTEVLLNIVGSLAPDEAIRAVFKWTNDFMLSNNVAASYRKYLQEETSQWMEQNEGIASLATASTLDRNDPDSSGSAPSQSNPTMEDYLQLKLQAWEKVSTQHGFDAPSLDQVNIAEFAGPEKAIFDIFKWTSETEQEKIQAIVASYRSILKDLSQQWMARMDNAFIEADNSPIEEETESIPPFILREGAKEWLSAIEEVSVPSVVISNNMDDTILNEILKQTGLSETFPLENRISASSIYGKGSQKMLGAALRLERRPDHCIVFGASPQSAVFAHEVEMKNIALVSPYPYFELTTSDMTVRDFKSIGMINLKNVFSETSTEEPMQQVQMESPKIQRKTMLKTRFWDDDDR